MKRNIFLFAVILTMGLTACGNESTTSNETTDSTATGADTTVVADSTATQETVDSAVNQ
jgi:ABC-type glycerol-3-phosphate transport system substrate-binding protein